MSADQVQLRSVARALSHAATGRGYRLHDERFHLARAALDAIETDVRRAVADEIEDALGDIELLPATVRAAFDDLLHRLRTGRDT